MTEQTTELVYEAPELIEVGDFNEVTLGDGSWGFDSRRECAIILC
ncbi:lasso RiPP family leader peptide-containing protein [Streptomyces carpaticus]|nr:lasso RiPP family leader peptide-containing protein [Streptomyces carpaticus]